MVFLELVLPQENLLLRGPSGQRVLRCSLRWLRTSPNSDSEIQMLLNHDQRTGNRDVAYLEMVRIINRSKSNKF